MASANTLDALGLAAFRAVVSTVVYATGFRAVSDDDFSRVVIAMRFVEAPSFDPSGTSWLPLPFWLMGGGMTVFGSSLEVARAVSFVEAVVGTLLLWQAARWLGLSRLTAWLGAAVASAFPYSAWLGVATVPEYFTASLVVLGIATTSSDDPRRRVLGSLALSMACLCRYEAWFVAAGFVVVNVIDAVRSRAAYFLLPAAIACSTPLLWMIHGSIDHGSTTFFLRRVATYRQAVGGSFGTAWQQLATYPSLLFTREPELTLLTLFGVVALWRLKRPELTRFWRPALLLVAMLLALVLGTVVGGAPTHHPERAVLPIWMFAALVLATCAVELQRRIDAQHHGVIRMVVAGIVLLALLLRFTKSPRQEFVARNAEVELGREARRLVGDGRVLIGAKDYGFFAMMAGFGAPDRAIPTDLRDPRSPRASDPFRSLASLQERIRRARAGALIAPVEHTRLVTELGSVRARRGDYLLIDVSEP